MSESTDVFVGSPASLEQVADVVSRELGIEFSESRDGDERSMTGHNADVHVIITSGHLYEADFGMDFPRYPVDVDIYGTRGPYMETAERAARVIFEALRKDGRFPLLLAVDLATKIDEYEPQHGASHAA